MGHDEIRFTLFTLLSATTFGLLLTILDGSTVSTGHFLLKFGFAVPAALLTIDMWANYNRFYQDRRQYGYRELFLDALVLALSYMALVTLKADPTGTDAEAFRDYPSNACWIGLVLYSGLKTYRAWPVYRLQGDEKRGMSWMSLLHVVLLVLILSAWGWQKGFPADVPIPFEWAGLIFTIVATIYLVAVYGVQWDPLTPYGVIRKWTDQEPAATQPT